MNFIKRHKTMVIMLAVFLILALSLTIVFTNVFYLDYGKDIYGNRLNDFDKHKISNQIINKIKDDINSTNKVEKVEYDQRGKLLSFIINVKTNISKEASKEISNKIIDNLSNDVKSYYDIQVFITEDELHEKSVYPIIGYKHRTTEIFIWTNN